ncbi:MAG: hypothetical protein V2I62_04510 [Bacteroidales bacterium]|nr:hypothetical protein [Bacteroidales bacterium]
MTRNYNMLGKVYQINTIDSFEGEILHKELEMYPVAEKDASVDIVVNYLYQLEKKTPLLRNPSIHCYYENGFRIELINASIEFHFSGKQLAQIDFCIKQGSALRAIANKWFSYQFTNRKESIGFIFHELVLIPSAFFLPDLSVVHASAIDDDGAILFGGTGGVGKTSLEMELCNSYDKSFFADDIVVINKKGEAFPNLSYPKIYGYNLYSNNELRKKIFENSGVLNRLHWSIRKSINPAIVRRRVNPFELYEKVTNQPKKIKAFYILVKDGGVEQIQIDKISHEKAAKLNKWILETEYQIFYKHLIWDEFNSLISENEPKLSYSGLMNRIEQNFHLALSDIETYIVKIPLHINHQAYLKIMSQLINSDSKV